MAKTLSYRRPGAIDASQLSVAEAIRTRERNYQAAAWSMLAVGLPALFIGPIMLSGFFMGLQFRAHAESPAGWWTVLFISSLIVIPILFWAEYRTRGEWFMDEMRSQGTTAADLWQSSSYGEWELRRNAAATAGYLEILLWAPRMVMDARGRWKTPAPAGLLDEASAIVTFLKTFDGGIPVQQIPVTQPGSALRYLVSREWIDVSKDWQRVWLLSDSRRALGCGT